MRPRTQRRAAWSVFGLIVLLYVANGVISLASHTGNSGSGDIVFALTLLAFPIVGVLIASRMPDNRIGWLLLAIGLGWSIAIGSGYADYGGHGTHVGTLPGATAAAAIGQGQWVLPVGLMGTFLLLLYPNGSLPGPRWRVVAYASVAAIVLAPIAIAIAPGKLVDAGYPHTDNPLGISAIPTLFLVLPIVLVPLSILASAISLVVRFRRSRGVERLQLKWLVSAGALVAALYVVVFPLSLALSSGSGTPGWLEDVQSAFSLSFALIPVAIGFAVLRRGLYGIDLIIRRTVLYAALLVLLGGFYAGGIWIVGTSLRTLTDRSDTVAVTVSTLLVFAIFQPVRARVQRALDQRFYRAKYDAQSAIESLSRTLSQQVELGAVEREILAVVRATVQPAHVGLWLRSEEP
jgi:hypothetical protein